MTYIVEMTESPSMGGTEARLTSGRGITLIELLVVLFILAILLALLLPALSAARERSRFIQCSNNLKQITLGLSSYATACGVFPGSLLWHSPLARVLPFLDQVPLYNSINFNSPDRNATIAKTSLSVFICGSDGSSTRLPSMTNYGLNAGTAGLGNAPFADGFHSVGFQNVTDGLSSTALAAEWLSGTPHRIRDPVRSVFQTTFPLINSGQFPKFAVECRDLDALTATLGFVTKGESWSENGFGVTLYNHALPPNEHSCTNGTLTVQGAWTAASSHSVGANISFIDGHVQFIRSSISDRTWSAIGTMNGQEVIESY
jgi:prepilin-type N-terminal cleavage/methylation domain-containing protein/prepilin-type processing-associated H-X9-DG protein